jgi:cytoskeletal protein CcmA (bactofilin family)
MLAKKDEQTGEILTWLGKDSYFEGKLALKHSLRIDGKIKGRLETTESLTVGREGEIQGDEIKVKNAVIGGTVIGNIVATGKITLEANSVFRGEMKTKKLVIHDGAVFEGHCSMSDSTSPGTSSVMNPAINFNPSQSAQEKKLK